MSTDSSAVMSLKRQFGSLKELITDWEGRSPAQSGSADKDARDLAGRIKPLLRSFKGFFVDYHAYFVRRIEAGDIPSDQAIRTLREVNRKTQDQWAILSRLLAQRRYGSPYYPYLRRADELAAAYYQKYTGQTRRQPTAGLFWQSL